MPTRYVPISGTEGIVNIAGTDYPCSRWQTNFFVEDLPIVSASSYPYVDEQPGFKTCIFIAEGIARIGFNPFVGASASYLGSYVPIRLTATTQGAITRQIASMDSALVTTWVWQDESYGVASWAITAKANYKFTDFGDNLA